jgi:hypothetical protein
VILATKYGTTTTKSYGENGHEGGLAIGAGSYANGGGMAIEGGHHPYPVSIFMVGHSDKANHQYNLTTFWRAAEYAARFVSSDRIRRYNNKKHN